MGVDAESYGNHLRGAAVRDAFLLGRRGLSGAVRRYTLQGVEFRGDGHTTTLRHSSHAQTGHGLSWVRNGTGHRDRGRHRRVAQSDADALCEQVSFGGGRGEPRAYPAIGAPLQYAHWAIRPYTR